MAMVYLKLEIYIWWFKINTLVCVYRSTKSYICKSQTITIKMKMSCFLSPSKSIHKGLLVKTHGIVPAISVE